MVSHKIRDDGEIQLVFTEFGKTNVEHEEVIKDPKRSGIYIPLVNQGTAFVQSAQYIKPVDLRANRDSEFARSNACKQWQPCRFTQVLLSL